MDPTVWLSAEQLDAFKKSPIEGSIAFINLQTYRARAAYPAGTENPEVTGRAAYDRYREVARRMLASVGGRGLWFGTVGLTLVGPPGETWDEAALAEYPSRQAFLDMIVKPEYRAALVHRFAAIEDCRCYVAQARFRNLDP